MAAFSATVNSSAGISAPRKEVWDALTDPVLLPKLTPLLNRIDAEGDIWTWHMVRIAALGVSIVPSFTERMLFTDGTRIEYTHEAPAGQRERAGAEGTYELSDIDGGTQLAISLTLTVDLPLPKVSAKAVEKVMTSMMSRTGERFSANLLSHLHAHEL